MASTILRVLLKDDGRTSTPLSEKSRANCSAALADPQGFDLARRHCLSVRLVTPAGNPANYVELNPNVVLLADLAHAAG